MAARCRGVAAYRPAALGLALLLAAAPAPRSAAQLVNPTDNQPLQVEADSGIEWDQNAHLYIARGNAVAIRGPTEVHADTLIAHYREAKNPNGAMAPAGNGAPQAAGNAAAPPAGKPAAAPAGTAAGGNSAAAVSIGGNSEIYRVDAEGHVTMIREGQTVVGDQAVYDLDQAILVVTGKGLKMTTATDVVTARDSLEWYDQKQIAVARGDAVAIRNGKTIKGDILTAYMVKTKPADPKTAAQPGKSAPAKGGRPPATPVSAKPAASPGSTPGSTPGSPHPGTPGEESKISRVDAQGHVIVTNGLDTGRGDFGVYNADSGICTLVKNVVITRATDVIKGQYGVMDLNNNVSRMLPAPAGSDIAKQRVQGLFVRQDQAAGPVLPGAPARPNPTAPAGLNPAAPLSKGP